MTPVPSPTLFSADGLVGLIFLIMIGVTLFGGFIAATAERLVRALSGIVICFTGVAGFYYFLNSPFMAMMQILIYVGAICVTISFAIMLAAPEEKLKDSPSNLLSGPFGFMIAALVFGGMTALALKTEWQASAKTATGSVREIGIHLLTTNSMVFELISIVLLIAIIGAIVIARGGRN
ncbi:MAG: NADH-quinone oxidoreductase subunit J family protein [Desulfocapsaceae bacterium]